MALDDSEIVNIGIVGEGSLANLFIKKLLAAGYSINILDANDNPIFEKSTIHYHYSLANLVRASSIIITITSDGPALENALFDQQGIVNYIAAGTVIVDMSSVSPEFIQEISEQMVEKEILFLDAVLINEEQHQSGLMQMMLIGGEGYAYEIVLPIFKRIVKNVKHLGVNGASQFYRQAFAVRAKKA